MVVPAPRTKRSLSRAFLENAVGVAQYYGFTHAVNAFADVVHEKSRHVQFFPESRDQSISPLKEGTAISLLPQLLSGGGNLPEGIAHQRGEPVMIYYWHMPQKKRGQDEVVGYFRLEIFGLKTGIAEALLIRTAQAILTETGFSDVSVVINTTGDRDSFARFIRECSLFYKKYADTLHTSCRSALKGNVLRLLRGSQEKGQPLKRAAPKPLAFLSEENRKHFTEVLEYLEAMEISYTINELLMGTTGSPSKTVFELFPAATIATDTDPRITERALAHGERYDGLARRFIRRDIPAVGISFPLRHAMALPARVLGPARDPTVYFIHLGTAARLKSFMVLELLRHARIPACQPLGNETLAERLIAAEKRSIPYTLIMGQKEALQDSIIVRQTGMRTQETISLSELSSYLKKARRQKEVIC